MKAGGKTGRSERRTVYIRPEGASTRTAAERRDMIHSAVAATVDSFGDPVGGVFVVAFESGADNSPLCRLMGRLLRTQSLLFPSYIYAAAKSSPEDAGRISELRERALALIRQLNDTCGDIIDVENRVARVRKKEGGKPKHAGMVAGGV